MFFFWGGDADLVMGVINYKQKIEIPSRRECTVNYPLIPLLTSKTHREEPQKTIQTE